MKYNRYSLIVKYWLLLKFVTNSTPCRHQVAVAEQTLQQTAREHSRQLTSRDSQLMTLREELAHVRQQHDIDRQRMVRGGGGGGGGRGAGVVKTEYGGGWLGSI